MWTATRTELAAHWLHSLCWRGDTLVDLLGHGTIYHLDGQVERRSRAYAYPFDAVVACDRFAVLTQTLGTKALLVDLDTRRDLRELNRSYYHATDYDYPITLFHLPDGRVAIAHCPDDYCTLELELAETGERLTRREAKSADIFHTRLAASPDGRFLAENAWVWHPWNIIACFDLEAALADPTILDAQGLPIPQNGICGWEPDGVTICGHRVVYSSILEHPEDLDDVEEEDRFEVLPAEPGVPYTGEEADRVRRLSVSELQIVDPDGNPIPPAPTPRIPPRTRSLLQAFDLDTGALLSSRELAEPLGRMMPLGPDHVIAFYDHPKLIEVATGRILARWQDLDPGIERASPSVNLTAPTWPWLAMDPAHHRFALGWTDRIVVMSFTPA